MRRALVHRYIAVGNGRGTLTRELLLPFAPLRSLAQWPGPFQLVVQPQHRQPEPHHVIRGAKPPIRGGRLRVPEGPGPGVRLDPDKVARAHEVYHKSGLRGRDDGSTMRLVEPGWKPEPF